MMQPKSGEWQISLCQSVAMHCRGLPTKETFAQRKVPRQVSPFGHRLEAEVGVEREPASAQLASLNASVKDLLADIATKQGRGMPRVEDTLVSERERAASASEKASVSEPDSE